MPVANMTIFPVLAHPVLAQFYGFEGTQASKIFMVGFAGLALVAAMFIKMSIRHWLMAGILFAAALTAPVNFDRTSYLPTWMVSIQIRRAEIHLGLGIILTLLALMQGRQLVQRWPWQSLVLLAMAMYAATMQIVHQTVGEAVQSMGFALATVPCMIIAAELTTRDREGCLRMLRTIMLVSVAWTVCCSIQFVINPKLLVNTGGRFWGMLANAQQAAILVAPFAATAIWLFMYDTNKRLKPLWVALAAINLLFLMWSGSRTGAFMFAVGVAFMLYSRGGKALLLMPAGAAVFGLLYWLALELQIMKNVERLTSSDNTRGWVWATQIESFLEHPLIGVGWGETGGSESSYLGGAAGYGIGFAALIAVYLFGTMWMCGKLTVQKRFLGKKDRELADMFIAWNAMYFGAAAFEGFMMGRSSTPQVMMLMFAGLGVYLKEQVAMRSRGGAEAGADIQEQAGGDAYGEEDVQAA